MRSSKKKYLDVFDWLLGLIAIAWLGVFGFAAYERYFPQRSDDAVKKKKLIAGEKLYYSKNCSTCHGKDGGDPMSPDYPRLKGQNANYIRAQLKEFKEGRRNSGQAALMQPLAAELTDEQIDLIAIYLESKR